MDSRAAVVYPSCEATTPRGQVIDLGGVVLARGDPAVVYRLPVLET